MGKLKPIFTITKYGKTVRPYECFYCCCDIVPYSYGILTTVTETYAWCYTCSLVRLKDETELLAELRKQQKEDNQNGC